MTSIQPGNTISTILKHDRKVTSYKIALLRAINDVVLNFPDIHKLHKDIAIPIRVLAEFWIAYYWPFVQEKPIYQGPRAERSGKIRNDMSFRPELTELRLIWNTITPGHSKASDGFFIINEFRIKRKKQSYPKNIKEVYEKTITKISKTIRDQPIRYAGPDQWTVFEQPKQYNQIGDKVIGIPDTKPNDICLLLKEELWDDFQQLSLWIEALCLHEWSLFTEKQKQLAINDIDRGTIYKLLTDRPENRRPLTWERNQIDILITEGKEFICPWTEFRIYQHGNYEIDHILPISIYPINELWNLVPSNPKANLRKSDKFPSTNRLAKAKPNLILAYNNYEASKPLSKALHEDVSIRFISISESMGNYSNEVTAAVINFIEQISASRNIARY